MNSQEKALARKLFKLKVHEAKGQAFEDLFVSIMNYAESDFRSIKPWGNIGDRKNDGYVKSKGVFYQVFAPLEILTSYSKVIGKLEKDFAGLLRQWASIHEFYFVVNDTYLGVNADCEQAIQAIKQTHGLRRAGFKTASNLEDLLFSLSDDQIMAVAGYLPDPATIQLDYSVLSEVIAHLIQLPLHKTSVDKVVYPDWDEKILFNGLNGLEAEYLNSGWLQRGSLDEYLNNQSAFFAEALKKKICEVYLKHKGASSGSDLFWKMVGAISPRTESHVQAASIVLMAKYFETCDIFREPK